MPRPIPSLFLLALLLAGPAFGQTPAERASRDLNEDVSTDRARDAARDARGDPRPEIPSVQQFEPDRRTLRPDVGRPEQSGTPAGTPRGATSLGPNPQR